MARLEGRRPRKIGEMSDKIAFTGAVLFLPNCKNTPS
jgi:hypothetical protein